MQPIMDALLAKKLLEEQKMLNSEQRKVSRLRIASHIEAAGPKSGRILFIAEGKSAIGSLINVRQSNHGGYPLRGKILNTREKTPLEIARNKEIAELMSIIGLQFGKEATLDSGLQYGTVCLMTDSDADGHHISALLLNFLANWPELFDQGIVHVVRSPIVIATKGKLKQYFYTLSDYRKTKLEGKWSLKYIKGLASLTEDEYSDVINKLKTYKIQLGLDYSDILDVAFGKSTERRKVFLSK